ncbi:MAG: DUF6069 family protein [Chloroflexota bacterium]
MKTNLTSERVSLKKLLWVTPIAAIAAFAGVRIVFFIARATFGLALILPLAPQYETLGPLTISILVQATVPPAIGASVLLVILNRFVSRPMRVFQWIAAIFLFVSLGSPLFLPPLETSTRIVLGIMHVVAGGAIVGVLSMLGKEK